MRTYKILLNVIAIMLFLLSSCSPKQSTGIIEQLEEPEPPNAFVRVDKDEYETVRGTYGWMIMNGDEFVSGVQADSDPPPELVKYQKDQILVSEGDLIGIRFDTAPNSYSVLIWNDNNEIETVGIIGENENFIVLSTQGEEVIYEIIAEWEQGTVHYAFKVLVE